MDGGTVETEVGSPEWIIAACDEISACAASKKGQAPTVHELTAGVLSVLVERFEGSRGFILGPGGTAKSGPAAEWYSWDLESGGELSHRGYEPSADARELLARAKLQEGATEHDGELLIGEGTGKELRLQWTDPGGDGWLVGLQRSNDASELSELGIRSFSSLATRAIELVAARRTQRELMALRSIDETLWQRAKQGLILLGEDGHCVRANAVAGQLLGLSEDELLRTPPSSWLPAPFALATGGAGAGNWQGLLASGTGLGVSVEIVQSQVFDTDTTMSLLQLIDRSHILSLEEQLQKLQQHEVMSRLCGGVVHDLNNLLTVIVAALEKAERDMGDRVQPLIFSDGQEAVRRCESLCSQLLTMGQCEPGPWQMIRPDVIIGGMERLLSRVTPEYVEFSLTLDAPDIQAVLPSGALELILLNLLTGASESLPKGSGLRMSTSVVGKRFHLHLEDNGAGMGEGQLQHAFQSPRLGQQQGGASTGFAVVHSLVSKIGGQIEVRSIPGRGTTIDVSFTAASDEPKTPPPPHSSFDPSIRGTGKTVLLCENDPVLRDVMAGTLSKQGYGVVTCSDGRRGLAMIESGKAFDALVTDLVMPNVGGAEVAIACNKQGTSTPVVFVSGLLERDALPEIKAAAEFLAKPFRMHDLLAALQVVLATSVD